MPFLYVVIEHDGWEFNQVPVVCHSRKSANKWIRDNISKNRRDSYRVAKVLMAFDTKDIMTGKDIEYAEQFISPYGH